MSYSNAEIKTIPAETMLSVEQLPPGLYWISQYSPTKGVTHHAILDIGNRARTASIGITQRAVIVHQTPPSIRCEPFNGTGNWRLLGKITDEQYAVSRLQTTCANPVYSAIHNNCEHFARYIATGARQSHQVQAIGFFGILFGFALATARS